MRRYRRTDIKKRKEKKREKKRKEKDEEKYEIKSSRNMNNTRCLKVYLTRVKDHDAHHHSRLPFKSSFTLHSPRSFSSHTITHRTSCFYCGPRGASFAPSMRGKKDGILSFRVDRGEKTLRN